MSRKYIAKLMVEGVIEKKNDKYDQQWLLKTIDTIRESKKNAGLMLYIDSPGGSVYETDEVYNAIMKYKEETKRPVYAYFGSLAASGGYYMGCSADKILANRNTITGSIGVIAGRFIDLSKLMEKHGVKSETIHAGKNKIMGSYEEPATDEQRAIMQSIADEAYEQFTSIVSDSRKMDIEKVRELADGRVYSAKQARDNGLVDDIMTLEDAEALMRKNEFSNVRFKLASSMKEYKLKEKRSLRRYIKGAVLGLDETKAIADEIMHEQGLYPAFLYRK